MCDYNCDVCEQPCGSCAGAIAPVKATEAMTQPVGQRHGQLYTEPANATIEQTTGQSTTTVMSQKAVTDAVEGRVPSSSEDSISISSEGDVSISAVVDVGIVGDQIGIHATDDVNIEGNNVYINGEPYRKGHQLVQSTGNSETAVMSQNAVSEAITSNGDLINSRLNKVIEIVFGPNQLPVSQTSTGWALRGDSNGTSVQNAQAKIVKYAVTEGNTLYLKISKDTVGTYQWQKGASVPGSGYNNNLVGTPFTEAISDIVTVPATATYLIVSQLLTNTSNKVLLMDDGEYLTANTLEITAEEMTEEDTI